MTLFEAKVPATKQRQVGRTDGRTGEDSTTRGRGESGNPAISLPGGLLVRIELRLPASRLRTRRAALSVHKRRRLPRPWILSRNFYNHILILRCVYKMKRIRNPREFSLTVEQLVLPRHLVEGPRRLLRRHPRRRRRSHRTRRAFFQLSMTE